MSLLYGGDRHHQADRDRRRRSPATASSIGIEIIGVVFVIVGFAFKVSAVPFHSWAPDTYEGAPTPVTAFLSVASKAAGFVALILVVFLAFPTADEVYGPFIWVLAALTMTVGNVHRPAPDEHRPHARLLERQPGRVHPDAAGVVDTGDAGASRRSRRWSCTCSSTRFTNLGAFAVVIAVSRKTRSGEISSFGGLIQYAPGLGRADDAVPRLARRHPAARWLDRQVQRLQGAARRRHDQRPTSWPSSAPSTPPSPPRTTSGDARDVDEDPPDGDMTPIVTPAAGLGGARHHDGRQIVARRAARPRHALRRPAGPERRRSAADGRGRAADDVRAAIDDAGGAMPFSTFVRARAVRTARLLHRPGGAGRPVAGATSSPSPEVGPLFGAVARPLPRRRVGAARAARPVHRRRRRRRARARWPAPCWRPRPACAPALRYVAVEVSAAQRARHPGRRRVASPTCPTEPFDGVVLANELLDNLPFRLAVHDGGVARGVRRRRAATARSPRCCRRRSIRCRRCCRRRPRHGARAPLQRRRGGVGGRGPRASSARGRSSSSTTSGRRRAELAALDRGGRGCARTAATSAAATPWPTRATRTSPSTSPSTSCRSPTPSARRPSSCAVGHRRAGRRGSAGVAGDGRGRPTSPRCAMRSRPARPRRCSTRPASAGSASCSGLPRSVERRKVGSAAPVRGGRVDEAVQPEPPAQQPNEPADPGESPDRRGFVIVAVLALVVIAGIVAWSIGRRDAGDAIARDEERFPSPTTVAPRPPCRRRRRPAPRHRRCCRSPCR